MVNLDRKEDDPWGLKTHPGTSEYTMHIGDKSDVQVLVCTVGSIMLLYGARYMNEIPAILMEFLGLFEPKHNLKKLNCGFAQVSLNSWKTYKLMEL